MFQLTKSIPQFKKVFLLIVSLEKIINVLLWELRAKKIKHNSFKKTVYYDSAVLKIYDFPIFYFPKFSHPDPTVDRRSGFLIPTFSNSTNMGAGIDIPYFWNII